ncbi:hypothetical protein GGI07_000464 [Coemansia sp. Benny D115]|nr:hypothetical protein GGI07_000464 [Coemansia sp. Benny D115]
MSARKRAAFSTRRSKAIPAATPVTVSDSSSPQSPQPASDDWAPSDSGLDITLSQVLGKSDGSHRQNKNTATSTKASPNKTKRSLEPKQHTPKKIKTPPLEIEEKAMPNKRSFEEVVKDIAAMFTDDDDDDQSEIDAPPPNKADKPESKPLLPPVPNLEFMDKESANNYRRILMQNKKRELNRARIAKRKSLPINFSSNSNDVDSKPDEKTILIDALDGDLPDDPLGIANQKSPRDLNKHKEQQAKHLSDSGEATDEAEVLDRRAILKRRLRNRRATMPVLSRMEQARLNAQQATYDSESEADNIDMRGRVIDDSNNSQDTDVIDMPETDSSDDEKSKTSHPQVLVINDTSDDDFISDPEETTVTPSKTQTKKTGQTKSNKDMNSFLSAFEPKRSSQMIGKLNSKGTKRKDTAEARHLKSPKKVKGYSDEIDDDIADFIVDDDELVSDDNSTNHRANNSAIDVDDDVVEFDDDKVEKGTSKPTFGKAARGAVPLLPDEFSQIDLPTSFKTYVQYLVYWVCNNKHQPPFSKDNAQYCFLAYITVARVIDSVEQSLVESSAWVDGFRNSLHGYPELCKSKIPGVLGCDACTFHRNRTATFCVSLSGSPYNRTSLAPPRPGQVADGSSEEESEDSSSSDERYSQTVSYNLGRMCMARAEVCHELHHYFYHLAHTVELLMQSVAYEKLQGTREKDVDDIWEDLDPDSLVELLEKQGHMDRLFGAFKEMLTRSKLSFAS